MEPVSEAPPKNIPSRRDTMKITSITLLIYLFAFGTGTVASAQGIEWEALTNEVMSLYRQGRYDQGVVVAKEALQIADQMVGPNHPSVADLNNLAELYRDQGRYAQAEPLYKRAVEIWEKALGPDHRRVATSLGQMAALCRATNRKKEAVELEQLAERIKDIKR
jgi:tetratricopeptide (TPR) repeat protein